MKRLLPLLAAGLMTALTASHAFAQGRPAMVGTAFVDVRPVAETVTVFGEVVAARDSAVASRVAGVVESVPVQVGDIVGPGDVLATLDDDLLSIELAQTEAGVSEAEAGLAVADARMETATRNFERIVGLQGTSAFSESVFGDRQGALAEAQGQIAQAEARVLSARAARDRAAYNLARATITAPFAGTVLEVSADPGQFIPLGAPIARLLDADGMEVQANVPSDYIGAIRAGQVAAGSTDAGDPLELTIRAVLPTEFAATRTRPVRFTTAFGAEQRPVALGQSVTVQVPVSQAREALTVPKDALVQGQGGGWTVFLHQDGKAMPRPVEVGIAYGDRFEVVSGLAAGDEVVVRGNERLRPMQDIQPMPAAGAARPAASN